MRAVPVVAACAVWVLVLGGGAPCRAVTASGPGWAVHFNLPDQLPTPQTTNADEYAIRDALLARINALQSHHQAALATYTFSGTNGPTGAAAPILSALRAALDRGARIAFVADSGVHTDIAYDGTNSLATLAARPVNPLTLAVDPSASGIMHDKLGLFDYGPTNRWVFVASWNFTAAACSEQWNIALEGRSAALYAAYSNEVAEFLAGRFHADPLKSHAHDRSPLAFPGSWDSGFVRFAPYPSSSAGGSNALPDVTGIIARAESEIVFALNKATRIAIATQLVTAADRGVAVHGVMPQSDTDGGDSSTFYSFITNAGNYATTNRVRFWPAYAKADYSASDAGEYDLVHTKYLVSDPFGRRPLVIHGSANWTASALSYTNENDENVLFLPHRGLARMFYAHFKRVTGAFSDRADYWYEVERQTSRVAVSLWTACTNGGLAVDSAPALAGPWTELQGGITGGPGSVWSGAFAFASNTFFRARR